MMFIDISVNDNLPFTKIGVHRTSPSGIPENGEMCNYDLYKITYDMEFNPISEKIGKIQYPYGDGNLLALEVLKQLYEGK